MQIYANVPRRSVCNAHSQLLGVETLQRPNFVHRSLLGLKVPPGGLYVDQVPPVGLATIRFDLNGKFF